MYFFEKYVSLLRKTLTLEIFQREKTIFYTFFHRHTFLYCCLVRRLNERGAFLVRSEMVVFGMISWHNQQTSEWMYI